MIKKNFVKPVFRAALSILFCALLVMPGRAGWAGRDALEETGHRASPRPDDSRPHPVPGALDFYKKHVSRVDGDRCPMYPSCSEYAAEAIRKHGLFMGWIMTTDRLMRCGRDELKRSPRIWVNGRERSHDPLTGNDFWR